MMKQAEVAWEMDVPQLRSTHYNATLIDTIPVNDELRRFRIRPDWPIPDFQPGQYVAVGLGNWEPRVTDVQPEILREEQSRKLVRRAYSISCSMLDESGAVVPAQHLDYLEFYVALVRRAARPPALTPRLFALRAGDRLLVEQHIVGHYTLAGVRPDDDVVFFATGTGEAPHNCMLAELLHRGHRGRLLATTCVRWRRDLGYLSAHRRLERMYPQYCYLPLTTREAVNVDPQSTVMWANAIFRITSKRVIWNAMPAGRSIRRARMCFSAAARI
jgi:ferredoxin/flavodoxin---NADP+ reductase